jgi:hypothetical protein
MWKFSDLVGSTALSARLDPEYLREVISALLGPYIATQFSGGFLPGWTVPQVLQVRAFSSA